MVKMFRVRLSEAHRQSGLTAYMVAKELGLNANTVMKYVREDFVTERISSYVLALASLYGVYWKDVIDEIEVEDPETSSALVAAS